MQNFALKYKCNRLARRISPLSPGSTPADRIEISNSIQQVRMQNCLLMEMLSMSSNYPLLGQSGLFSWTSKTMLEAPFASF